MFIFLAGFMLYSTWGVWKAAKAGMVRHPSASARGSIPPIQSLHCSHVRMHVCV